jgi:CheY-like chemotaxis protein
VAPPAETGERAPLEPPRVLLVEDNAVNQKLARRLLEKSGMVVETALNGREAVDCWSASDYQIVFMDCQMPEMDGFEATAEIRRREGAGRRTPIVAITAYAMDGDRERCLLAGMDDYIPKPIRPGVLEQALQTWFSRAQDAAQTETSRPEDDLQTLA